MTVPTYTTQLGAGLGMIAETQTLLDLWEMNMRAATLNQVALRSGRFPNMSARRLRNFVGECFARRYLVDEQRPAQLLKAFRAALSQREWSQLLFLFTSRADLILRDFVGEVYWPAYEAGRAAILREQALHFVMQARQSGKTTTTWSDSTVQRVSGYLLGCCVDFGLLDGAKRGSYTVLPFRIASNVAVILAHELHFAGLSDAGIVAAPDWALFGMERADVLSELKRQALAGWMIVQSAGDVVQISWRCSRIEELIDGIAGQ